MGRPPWLAWKGKPKDPLSVGLRHGFRSGLEKRNADHLIQNCGQRKVRFELVKIKYAIPATMHSYTVDFELDNGILVETKGRFLPQDRAKHLYVKLQHPDLDIRLVFQNPNARLSPKNPKSSTYAEWADAHGIKWATKLIPVSWAREPGVTGGARGARIIAVSEETAHYFAGAARLPQQARGSKAGGRPAAKRKASRSA